MEIKELDLEKENLIKTQQVLEELKEKNIQYIKSKNEKIEMLNAYIEDNPNMPEFEKVSTYNQQNDCVQKIFDASKQNSLYSKLHNSPYFAKIKINCDGEIEDYYIGIKGLIKDESVYAIDWRMPLCSLFYDGNLGKSFYVVDEEKIEVDLLLKRQLKIENGELKFFYDTNTKINDELLLESLSNNSSPYMKNIVATIQAEQNKIIRENQYTSAVINGVAGSGKTSIGMHRIAYLLFKDKDNLKNKNIIIISPNKLFTEYISKILPELGEENVEAQSMVEILNSHVLEIGYSLNKNVVVEDILSGNIKRYKEMEKKYSLEFFNRITKELVKFNDINKIDAGIKIDGRVISKEEILEVYFQNKTGNLNESLNITAERLIENVFYTREQETQKELYELIKLELRERFFSVDMLEFYKNILKEYGFNQEIVKNGKINFEDLANLVYIKHMLFGIAQNYFIKQIFIDEMQDYDATSIMLLKILYPKANITLVGDYNQNLLFEGNNMAAIKEAFADANFYELETNYRSTSNIARFSSKILGKQYNSKFIREGEEPEIIKTNNQAEEINRLLAQLKQKGINKIAVICKNNVEVEALSKEIDACHVMLMEQSEINTNAPILTSVYYSKGLEFDAVILPNVTADNYKTEVDRRLLYVACTRALHKLILLYDGNRSKFINE